MPLQFYDINIENRQISLVSRQQDCTDNMANAQFFKVFVEKKMHLHNLSSTSYKTIEI